MAGYIDVHSFAEFDAVVVGLRAGGRRLVYRGQSRDYGAVTPSALRPTAKPVDARIARFFHLFLNVAQQQWEAEFYGQISYQPSERDLQALMQHYWFPTKYLDVTYEPRVALWFATHEFVFLTGACGRYVPARLEQPAIVYVFDPAEHLEHIEPREDTAIRAVALTKAPEAFGYHNPSRLRAQQAALLTGASRSQPDLLRHVTACLRVHPDIKQDPLWASFTDRYSVENLFYANDDFYGILMFYNRTYLDEKLVLIENKWMKEGVVEFWAGQVAEELAEQRPRNLFRSSVPWW